ncbi:MAG TPA: ATP-dependent helicase [Streptosporangiaceae bacterium]|nr:ATP-dependent helicase [Streptosporangiaceae bacterium]
MAEESPLTGTAGALDGFSPAARAWFGGAFAEPTQAQAGAWQAIGKGEDTLVVAPTGSGKTLAAFLWAIDKLAAVPPPQDPKRRTRVLYVSPLKALAVDIERNLRAPLTGIRHAAHRLGLAEPDIGVAVRTGDTAAEDRRKLVTKPPDILITTPESLFLLLTSQARETLRGVETVIVDEVHAVAGNKRGAHLALSLERLDALRGSVRPAQRVGLSATVRPVGEVATFLGGARPVTVVQPPSPKRIELTVVVPVEDMTELDTTPGRSGSDGDSGDGPAPVRSIWPHVEARVLDLIEQHKSTIVFANSRRLAERLCGRLNELAAERAEAAFEAHAGGRMPAEIMGQAGALAGAPAEVARAHHGSVSRQERAEIEEALKAGRLPAVVATSSLELGIDMGAVDLVVQVEAPPSVASGLQRVGRAGHNVGDVSRGIIFPKYQGDLVQAAVVAERMRDGQIEELKIPHNPLDVLAQQVVAMTAVDDWPVDELERTVRRAAPFGGLTRPILEAVLDMLAGRYPSEDFAGLRPRIVWDRVAGIIRARPGAQRLAVTSGGTIPDRGLFGVFLASAGDRQPRRVGELDEEMVYESRVGDVFVLGASSWRIEDITPDRVLVTPAPGQPGRLPFWHGDTPGRPAELGRAIGAAVRSLASVSEPEARASLERAGLDELAARNLIRYLADQRAATGYVPDDRTLVVERFRDELGDWRVVLHSPYGDRVHAPWALAIAARLRERYGGMDVQALHTDDGILIRVPESDEPPPSGIALIDPDEIGDLVTAEVGASALFASRFRECASRALLLPRRQPGRRTPLWQQRQRSAQLLEIASRYPAFPIVLETVREVLRDVFDVPALTGLLRDIAARRIRIVEVETATPSPFGKSLLFRYVGAFMYEGDAPLAERRAQALSLDTALLAELLGQDGLRELLDPSVVDQTERDLQHLSESRRCRDLEGVFDLLRTAGPLTAAEVAARCVSDAAVGAWLSDLASARRVIQARIAGQPMWAAIEDAGRLRDALGVPLPLGVPEAFTEPVADALGDLVARYARTHGPFATAAVAGRYGLGAAVVTMALRRLAADGRVVEGEFLPTGTVSAEAGPAGAVPTRAPAGGTEWCDAEVLRLLRRRCLARLRKEAEPVPPEVLARFLPAWHGIGSAAGAGGSGRRRADAGAVLEVVERLAGAPVPASALETLVLPGRIPGYSPALLDELTSAGEVVWSGAGALPGGDGWLVLAPADGAPVMLPEAGEVSITPLHEAVLEVLSGGGALFFRMLSDRVAAVLGGSLPDDSEVAAAIWDLTWAGLLTNDTLAPLRVALGGQQRRAAASPRAAVPRPRPGGPGRRYGFGRPPMPTRTGPPTVSGRWSLLPGRPEPSESSGGEGARTVRAHALALTLLERHGVLTRGAVASERIPGGFAAVYPVLRAMEEAGQCRRGYFVEGLGAAQFALPGAVDRMRALADRPRAGDPGARASISAERAVVLAAADPAQPYGAALPWPDRPGETPSSHRPGRKAGALVVLVDGSLVLYVERGGRTLLSWTDDPEVLGPGATALAASVRDGALGRLSVERADGLTVGSGVHGSPLAQALEAAGFRPTPRGLRLRAS